MTTVNSVVSEVLYNESLGNCVTVAQAPDWFAFQDKAWALVWGYDEKFIGGESGYIVDTVRGYPHHRAIFQEVQFVVITGVQHNYIAGTVTLTHKTVIAHDQEWSRLPGLVNEGYTLEDWFDLGQEMYIEGVQPGELFESAKAIYHLFWFYNVRTPENVEYMYSQFVEGLQAAAGRLQPN